ncbi:MAG: hypothetical protein E6J23_04680 [Chloroflexi bacterium]|nr:MAG: hypothetical protein E6J23_04680 [Chloroflexota bacterium]
MSDERHDDEILGRALSRAIETIDVNQTPYERSRIATAPARGSIFGLWQIATAVGAIVLAVAIGSWLTRPTEQQPGVASSPTASPATSSGATTTPGATATPAPTAVDHSKIYLGRPGLPPIAVSGPQFASTAVTANERIASRITALRAYRQSTAPYGLTNYLWSNSFQGGVSVVVAADLAKVDLQLGQPFSANDHAAAFAILQQLVYTATEEAGIRRVLLTENGGQPLSIGDIPIDKPLAREDVFGYSVRGPIGRDQGIKGGNATSPVNPQARFGLSPAGDSLVRFTLDSQDASGNAAQFPPFEVWMEQSDDRNPTTGKYTLNLSLLWNLSGPTGAPRVSIIDLTPVRATVEDFVSWKFALDDARPWRAYLSPAGTTLTVEIGGDPRATSDRIAVSAPNFANAGADVRLVGSARVFEANVSWRLMDASAAALASGHFNASLGSSALWGTFDTSIPLPANVRGDLTLELFESSPKDGSAQGIVQIPLVVR